MNDVPRSEDCAFKSKSFCSNDELMSASTISSFP